MAEAPGREVVASSASIPEIRAETSLCYSLRNVAERVIDTFHTEKSLEEDIARMRKMQRRQITAAGDGTPHVTVPRRGDPS